MGFNSNIDKDFSVNDLDNNIVETIDNRLDSLDRIATYFSRIILVLFFLAPFTLIFIKYKYVPFIFLIWVLQIFAVYYILVTLKEFAARQFKNYYIRWIFRKYGNFNLKDYQSIKESIVNESKTDSGTPNDNDLQCNKDDFHGENHMLKEWKPLEFPPVKIGFYSSLPSDNNSQRQETSLQQEEKTEEIAGTKQIIEFDKNSSVNESEDELDENLLENIEEGLFIEQQSVVSEYNNRLGLLGEEFVVEFEINKFLINKEYDLADRVKHVSKIDGDGLGYDVLSFDDEGNEIYIEVKTTVGDLDNQFFISKNEYDFFNEHPNCLIYRVYNYNLKNKTGKIKVIRNINAIITSSVSYKITPKKIKQKFYYERP